MRLLLKWRHSLVLQNALALTILQASGNIATLITLPYLTRVMGPDSWGEVAWIQVLLGYLVIVADWGFSWHGTSIISKMRNEPREMSRIFIAGWIIQLFAALTAALAFLIAMNNFYLGINDRAFALWGGLYLLSTVIFPGWLPGGLERLREVALVQFVVRLSSLPLIFILVKSSGDGPLVIASLAVGGLVGGLLGVAWMLRNVAVVWSAASRSTICAQTIAGGEVLFSRLIGMVYSSSIPILLGLLSSLTSVGLYMVVDRLRAGVLSLINPVGQAMLPRISHLYATDRVAAKSMLLRFIALMSTFTGLIGILFFVFSKQIVIAVGGERFAGSAPVLQILAFAPFLTCITTILVIQVLIPNGLINVYSRATGAVGVFGGLIAWFAIDRFGLIGGSVVALLNEFIVSLIVIRVVAQHWRQIF